MHLYIRLLNKKKEIKAVEMRMPRWMYGVSSLDRTMNEYLKEGV